MQSYLYVLPAAGHCHTTLCHFVHYFHCLLWSRTLRISRQSHDPSHVINLRVNDGHVTEPHVVVMSVTCWVLVELCLTIVMLYSKGREWPVLRQTPCVTTNKTYFVTSQVERKAWVVTWGVTIFMCAMVIGGKVLTNLTILEKYCLFSLYCVRLLIFMSLWVCVEFLCVCETYFLIQGPIFILDKR